MKYGDFQVIIPEGDGEREGGYVPLGHGRQYTIRLRNHSRLRCDARVVVDGKEIGTFRLNGHETCNLERPPTDDGRFTFYKTDTEESASAGEGNVGQDDRGLVQVTFTPEKEYSPPVVRANMKVRKGIGPRGMSFCGEEKTSAGITGLSGHSGQKFTTVGPLNYDTARQVTISLRLVHDGKPKVRELVANRGNPVPPPV